MNRVVNYFTAARMHGVKGGGEALQKYTGLTADQLRVLYGNEPETFRLYCYAVLWRQRNSPELNRSLRDLRETRHGAQTWRTLLRHLPHYGADRLERFSQESPRGFALLVDGARYLQYYAQPFECYRTHNPEANPL